MSQPLTPTLTTPDTDTYPETDDFQWPLYDESWIEAEETSFEAWMESRSDDRYEVQPDARDPRTS